MYFISFYLQPRLGAMEVDVAINAPRALEIFNGKFYLIFIFLSTAMQLLFSFFLFLQNVSDGRSCIVYSIHIKKDLQRSYI